MKLVTYMDCDSAKVGLVEGDHIVELDQYKCSGIRRLLSNADWRDVVAQSRTDSTIPIAGAVFAPVVPDPNKILAIGLNYETHRIETGREPAAYPSVFVRFADTQVGHGQPIRLPQESICLDYEGELAVVIGKPGRRIPKADAMEHIAGYACYNDATIRDWQRHTHQFTPGKNFPGTGPFGPWLVSADEITDYRTLEIETRLNGEVMQRASLSDMLFTVPDLIAYVSNFTPLAPGDVILTGTPGGVGFKRDPQVFMTTGDVVEVEISGIGILSNTIVAE